MVVSIRTINYIQIGDEMVCLLNAELDGDESKKLCCIKSFPRDQCSENDPQRLAHSRGSEAESNSQNP